MLSQNQIKRIVALKSRKGREEQMLFLAEGSTLVTDLVGSRFRVAEVYAAAGWIVDHLPLLTRHGIQAFETLPREMERISGLATPSPVLAVVEIPNARMHECTNEQMHDITTSPRHHGTTAPRHHITTSPRHHGTLTLALDDIRDPGNLGTILRLADWFGIREVYCSPTTVELYNPKVVQATMGSIARVNASYGDLAPLLGNREAGRAVYGAMLGGEDLYAATLSTPAIVVIGNESRGISAAIEPLLSHKLFIPSFGEDAGGRAESLNASIATAVIIAEFRRQERQHEPR